MVRVYLELKNNEWKEVEHSSFWIDRASLNRLKFLEKIRGDQWDGVIIVDGKERGGKSTLGMICGWYLSKGKLTEKNFAVGTNDCARKIATLPDESILMIDEGSTMLSSKNSTSQEQKRLIEILDVVGQKRLIFIICLPCFFDLNKTIAVRRSKFLIHVYEDENYKRGRYSYWGETLKPKLYKFGKKNFDSYAYPPAEFLGEYFPFEPPFYKTYLEKIKDQTLQMVLKNAIDSKTSNELSMELKQSMVGKFQEVDPKYPQYKIAKIIQCNKETIPLLLERYKMAQ